MNNKTYYDVLNISHNASQEEIKKAYKIMAMKWHPDKNNYDTSPQFKDISEAYQVLSNDKLKHKYDLNLNLNLNKNKNTYIHFSKPVNFTNPYNLFNNIFSILNIISNDKLANEYINQSIYCFEATLVNNLCPIVLNEINNLNIPNIQKYPSKNKTDCLVYKINNDELDKLIKNAFS